MYSVFVPNSNLQHIILTRAEQTHYSRVLCNSFEKFLSKHTWYYVAIIAAVLTYHYSVHRRRDAHHSDRHIGRGYCRVLCLWQVQRRPCGIQFI